MRHVMRRRESGAKEEGGSKSLFHAFGALLVCLLVCSIFLVPLERGRQAQEREKARYIVESYATKIRYAVTDASSSAYLMEALLRQGEGQIRHFESYAAELVKMHPSTVNINLAPGGVVSRVFPHERNSRAIGHDLLSVDNRSREARLARDTGKATVAGPFVLVQGGYAMAVRLPVFFDGTFWGLVCATFAFPQVLEPVQLDALAKQGYDYQLLRIHPDTGERAVLLGSSKALDDPVEAAVVLPNVRWTLRVTPQGGWRNWNPSAFGIALFISLLFSCVVGLNSDLARQKRRLEHMSEHDPLTGLPNRRVLSRKIEAAMAAGRPFALCYMDIDRFKQINDTYGHDGGDRLLIRFAERFRAELPPSGLLIRLGGDEFVAIVDGIEDRRLAETLFRGLLDAVGGVPYRIGDREVASTVSLGLSLYPSEADSPEELLRKADADMYGHKKSAPEGR